MSHPQEPFRSSKRLFHVANRSAPVRIPKPSGSVVTTLAATVLIAIVLTATLAFVRPVPVGADPVAETSTAIESPVSATPVPDGVRDSVVRLYHAVFARNPDASGQDYWVGRYMAGMSLPDVAGFFIQSPEWTSSFGEVDNRHFVELLYNNVLDRQPDSGGWDYWSGRLDSGEARTAILLGFSESSEFIADTGTASPVPPPFPAIPPSSGAGRRIVYSNSGQRIWMVEADETIHNTYLVSGRENVPLAGTYSVYSKSPKAWAGHNGITMEHMVRFAWGRTLSIGFHSIPRYSDGRPMQSEEQLGTYRSGGCVRQRDDLALALYEWAPIGTTVVVLR